jgi:tetratricopeptide (TPR) repeat protein
MKVQTFKKSLASVLTLWSEGDYESALREVEVLLKTWPGNAQLHVMRAGLIQLQDGPTAALHDAKQSLEEAVALDEASPAAAIELGHFFDAVEDDPKAASKVYSKAIVQLRRLLVEALIGQAKALLQLDKKDEALKCLSELIRLSEDASVSKRNKAASAPGIILRSANGHVSMLDMQGPYTAEIEELIKEVGASNGTKAAS